MKPPPIIVHANNFFHAGWVAALLGQPKKCDKEWHSTVMKVDRDAWNDGWETASESRIEITCAIIKMCDRKQLTVIY